MFLEITEQISPALQETSDFWQTNLGATIIGSAITVIGVFASILAGVFGQNREWRKRDRETARRARVFFVPIFSKQIQASCDCFNEVFLFIDQHLITDDNKFDASRLIPRDQHINFSNKIKEIANKYFSGNNFKIFTELEVTPFFLRLPEQIQEKILGLSVCPRK